MRLSLLFFAAAFSLAGKCLADSGYTPPPIPSGPIAAIAAALERPPGTPPFAYGEHAFSTMRVYQQLRGYSRPQLEALERAVHRQPAWLRELTKEVEAGGLDLHGSLAEAEGARLLWQWFPRQYPPLAGMTGPGQADTTSTAFYDPRSGVVSLSENVARWPRPVSLLHEAMHAQQSQPGPVTWALLASDPWSPRTWLYSAMRDNPQAMDATVELGPSLASGLAIAELYHRCRPAARPLDVHLVAPSGRRLSVEWMRRQAHAHGLFGDSKMLRSTDADAHIAGMNELLGESAAGQQFVRSLVGE